MLLYKKAQNRFSFTLRITALAAVDGGNSVEQIVFHQYDIRCLQRDVGSGADGDAYVGTGQSRRIVDAVAYHGDFFAALLQLADFVALYPGVAPAR